MARFFGPIGFAIPTETRPGVWSDRIEEHNYRGDIISVSSRWMSSTDGTNDDLTFNNKVSIVADPFARNRFHTMKYIRIEDAYWRVVGVEPQYPRLILTIGGVYNGPKAES